jgi:predicted transcriptional regulator
MESAGPNGYALFGAMGLVDWILQSLSRLGARFPFESSSIAIALALMVGLKHPIRRRIYDHLVRLPGDHFRSVARSLNLAVGTARYHLDALAREGLVYKHDTNGRARYYVTGGEADVNRLYARHWEYRDVRLRIHGTLRRLEKAQPATIAKVLGISRQLVSYHLAVLEKAGRVRRQGAHYRLVSGR